MTRLIIYDKLTNVIKKIEFIEDYSIDKLPSYFGSNKSINEFLLELSVNGLSLYITDISEPYSTIGYRYEINIVPYRRLNQTKVTVLQFITDDFDEEELNAFLNIPQVNDIYLTDDKFKKLIDSVITLGGDSWKVIFNYLTDIYGFTYRILHYNIENDNDSSN